MIQAQQNEYHQALEDSSQRDWERLNEKLEISYARIDSNEMNIIIHNRGGVTVHLVDLWIRAYNQTGYPLFERLYDISVYIEPGKSVLYTSPGTYYDWYDHTVKFVTMRGTIVTSEVPYPPIPELGSTSNYALIIADDQNNFQYAAGSMMDFKPAYVKPRNTVNTLYRILLNNTTPKRIIFLSNTTMYHMVGGVGQTLYAKYIVTDMGDRLPTFDKDPDPYVFEDVDPYGSTYFYFGASTEGGNEWQEEPNTPAVYNIGFIIAFRYEGETEARSLSLPVVVQQLI
jgi:hypothetical protein